MALHHRDTVITSSSRTRMSRPLAKSRGSKRRRNTVPVWRLKSAIPTAEAAMATRVVLAATKSVSHE